MTRTIPVLALLATLCAPLVARAQGSRADLDLRASRTELAHAEATRSSSRMDERSTRPSVEDEAAELERAVEADGRDPARRRARIAHLELEIAELQLAHDAADPAGFIVGAVGSGLLLAGGAGVALVGALAASMSQACWSVSSSCSDRPVPELAIAGMIGGGAAALLGGILLGVTIHGATERRHERRDLDQRIELRRRWLESLQLGVTPGGVALSGRFG